MFLSFVTHFIEVLIYKNCELTNSGMKILSWHFYVQSTRMIYLARIIYGGTSHR